MPTLPIRPLIGEGWTLVYAVLIRAAQRRLLLVTTAAVALLREVSASA